MEANQNHSWQKYTLTAILGALAGIVATHNTHGLKIASIEIEIKTISTQLDRIERNQRHDERK